MPMCEKCGEVVGANEFDFDQGLCSQCNTLEARIESSEEKAINDEIEKRSSAYKSAGEREKKQIRDKIWVTTESMIDLPIKQRIDIVQTQAVYGMNIGKNFLTGIRDIVGGRIANIENALKDAKDTAIKELKEEAYFIGADAIVAIQIHQETMGSILSVVATGTAIKLR